MSTDPKKPEGESPPEGPKIDWAYQMKYTLVMIVGIAAVLMLLRYFGLRG
jgi:hypothetical protein